MNGYAGCIKIDALLHEGKAKGLVYSRGLDITNPNLLYSNRAET